MNEIPAQSTVNVPIRSYARWEFIQMATGVALSIFMLTHMALVASILLDFGGGAVFNLITKFFAITYGDYIIVPVVLILLFVHFVTAARKLPSRVQEMKTMWVHANRFQHTDTWLWLVQAITAFIVLVIACAHIWMIITNLPLSASSSAARIQGGFWLGAYLVLLVSVELHLAIGMYRVGVKWGFITRANREKWGLYKKLFSTVMIILGLASLFVFYAVVKH